MAFRFSEFLCVWPKPNDGGGRSQDGDVKFGVLESTGYTTSSSSWCEGASHPGASHPPEYKTGHRRGWTRSPCSWNKGQQSTEEACLLQETAGSAERTTRLRAVQGWPRGWRTRVCVWGRRRGRVCVCVHVFTSHQSSGDTGSTKNQVDFLMSGWLWSPPLESRRVMGDLSGLLHPYQITVCPGGHCETRGNLGGAGKWVR